MEISAALFIIAYLVLLIVVYIFARGEAARRNDAITDFLTPNDTQEIDWSFFLTQ